MPNKPQLQFSTIEIPSAYIKVINTFANICLEEDKRSSLLTFKEIFQLAEIRFPEYVYVETDVNGEYKSLSVAGFNFDTQGNVEFLLKYYIPSQYFNLFSIEFYGPVTPNQLQNFFDFLKKNSNLLKDIDIWFNYRIKTVNSHKK